jgi:uncharacterized protein YeaO (DUF488 family)
VGDRGVVVREEELPLAVEEVITVIGQVRGKALGYAARPGCQPEFGTRFLAWLLFTPGAGQLGALDDVAGTDEATVGLTWLCGDEIDGVMHPVGEVTVDVARRSEHGFVPVGLAAVGMRPWVPLAGICFDLSYPDGDGSVAIRALKHTAEQLRCMLMVTWLLGGSGEHNGTGDEEPQGFSPLRASLFEGWLLRRAVSQRGGWGMSTATDVQVRRVYDGTRDDDGVRVLVDRIWPRGMTKAKAALDEWCKDVSPSTELRKWYGHDPAKFDEFAMRYKAELEDPARAQALDHLRGLAKGRRLTLLTATKAADISEARVLADLIAR